MNKIQKLINEITTISDLGKPTNTGFAKKKCRVCGNDLDKDLNCSKCNKKYNT